MTARPPPPSPPEPERDPLAIGLGALAGGIGFGGATMTLAQVVVKLLQGRMDPASVGEAAKDPLLVGVFAGVLVATLFAWRRSGPLDNIWQRGVIGTLAGVGALLVGFLAVVPDHFLGLGGVMIWGILSVVLGVAGNRWAIRGTREQGAGSGNP